MMDGCKRFVFLFFSFEKVHVSCFDVKSIYFFDPLFLGGVGSCGFQGGFGCEGFNYIVQQV